MQNRTTPAFLTGGGDAGAVMRRLDWSESPLGPPAQWPASLGTVVGLMLNSKFPMFVAWGPELGFLYNDPYAEILGEKHRWAMGQRFQNVWPEIWSDIYPIIQTALRGEASFHQNLPLTMQRKGYPEQTWFTFSYSPVRDESGEVAGMFCACTETTQQVRAERQHAEELESLRHLFQQAPGIIAYIEGPDHVFRLHNDAYLHMVGRNNLLGLPVRAALPEVEGQGFIDLLDRVYRTGEPFVGHEVPVRLRRRAEGQLELVYVNFIYQPVRDLGGRVTGIFVEGSDVTRAVLATRALQESEQRLRQLVNTIPQIAWIADPAGRVHWYNDRWFEYTGGTSEKVEDVAWEAVFHPDDLPEIQRKWQAAVASGRPYEASTRIRGAQGNYRNFVVRAAPLRNEDGDIVQWFGTTTDVTDIEHAQSELKAANQRKDEFLAMLAHELRNPLAPISTAAELLRVAPDDRDGVRQAGTVISRQVGHMTNLVDDLLDVSRVTRGLISLQQEDIELHGLLADALEQVRSLLDSRQHALQIEPAPESVVVRGDRTRLIQIFSNLLNNAAKYTPPGGTISLRVEAGEETVDVSVQDSGIGIPANLLPHIFELFTQAERSPDRSQGGVGLGLALARSLVELHDGRIWVQSEGPGKGSQFTVCLPRLAQASAPLDPAPAESGLQLGEARFCILVVDDNVDAAQTLGLLMEAGGHVVHVANDARDALEKARRLRPEVLFLDIGLPDMDGYALARLLREMPELAGARLVAVTGYGQPEDRRRSEAAGFDHHLVKPVSLLSVLEVLPHTGEARGIAG